MVEKQRTELSRGEQPLPLRGVMDRLFEQAFVPSLLADGDRYWPPMDIRESDDAFAVSCALPGVKPEDVHISVENQTLSIRGQFRDESEDQEGEVLYRERKFGSFNRQIQLPTRVEAEKADATFTDGILRLSLPKAEETKPRRIEIKPGAR